MDNGKWRIFFCYKMINFLPIELKFSRNIIYFSYNKKLRSTKVEKVLGYREMINTVTNLSYIELGEVQISLHKIVHWLRFCALHNKIDKERKGNAGGSQGGGS